MTVPFPGLEPAPGANAPDIIDDIADLLGGYGDFVFFGALQDRIPHPDHVGYLVYAVRKQILVFTEIAWCRRQEAGVSEALLRSLMRASTQAAAARIDDNAFDIGEVYLTRLGVDA